MSLSLGQIILLRRIPGITLSLAKCFGKPEWNMHREHQTATKNDTHKIYVCILALCKLVYA